MNDQDLTPHEAVSNKSAPPSEAKPPTTLPSETKPLTAPPSETIPLATPPSETESLVHSPSAVAPSGALRSNEAPWWENPNRPSKPPYVPFELKIDSSLVPTFTIFAFVTALLYTVSFTGITVFPQLSFFIFCGITVTLLCVMLKRIGWLNHPRAFLWAFPLMIFAGFNLVFGRSVFTYLNVAAAWILFAFIIFGAIHGTKYPFGALHFWSNMIRVTVGNMIAGFHIMVATSRIYKLTKNHPALRFLIGVAIALPLTGIILLLMLSADQVFAALLYDFFDGDGEFNIARLLGHIAATIIATIFFAGYVYSAKFIKHSKASFKPFDLDRIVAMAFLMVLNFVFLVFCYVQLAYLFMGGFNTLPSGVVFAEYAREGFFQLLFITIINFAVIIIFLQVYHEHARSGIIRLMLTMLTLFTAVLIASSFYRMNMYMQVFGFTPLRMAVITFLVMEVFLVLFTLIALYRGKFDVMRVYLITGMVFLLVANVSASGFVSGRLNVRQYGSRHFTMRDHFHSADNAGSLIEIHNMTNDEDLQHQIRSRLVSYHLRYANEPWQNRSIIKRINMRRVSNFMTTHPYLDWQVRPGLW